MRIEFYTPSGDGIEPVRDVLAMAGVNLPLSALEPLTKYELVLAYDWAFRIYLQASDAIVRTRLKPAFLDMLEEAEASKQIASWPVNCSTAGMSCWKPRLVAGERHTCLALIGSPHSPRDLADLIREHASRVKHEEG